MKVLGIESSCDILSVSIIDEGRLIGCIKSLRNKGHSAYLTPMIKDILKMAKLSLDDMYGFALSIGPGSFTGLRVGVATVKGLSFATGKPVIGIPTLDVIADNLGLIRGIACPILDAKKGKVYTTMYEYKNARQKRLLSYKLITADEAIDMAIEKKKDTIFLGDGLKLYKNRIKSRLKNKASFAPEHLWFPSAETVARIGEIRFKEGKREDPEELLPMYMYSKECSIKGI